jgi:G3E family GTPase
VDAAWFLRPEGGEGERVLARRQVGYADVVAFSMCDLMGAGDADEAEAAMKAWNRRALVVRMPFGLPDLPGMLAGPDAHAAVDCDRDLDVRAPQRDHLHGRYRIVSWRFPMSVQREAFAAWLANLGNHGVVRAKGFVRFTDSPDVVHVFQKTFGQHFVERFPASPAPAEFGVLIGPELDAEGHRSRLAALWSGQRLPPRLRLGAQG